MISSSGGASPIHRAAAILEHSQKLSAGESFANTLSAVWKGEDPSSAEDALDTVSISGGSPLLSKARLILPTLENVRKISSALKDELGNFFRKSGIPLQPPVELSVNGEGKIMVKGDREDREQIAERINENADLAERVRTLSAISGIAWSLPEHLRFQAEYRASNNPETVVARYSHLFGPRSSPQISMRFGEKSDGDGMEVLVDGKPWTQTFVADTARIEETVGKIADEMTVTLLDTVNAARKDPSRLP